MLRSALAAVLCVPLLLVLGCGQSKPAAAPPVQATPVPTHPPAFGGHAPASATTSH